MGLKRAAEFRQDAVRIALTSGLTRKQGADDLSVGMSTLNKWITAHRDTDFVSKEDMSLTKENDRLRSEIRLLKEEREILKKATQFFYSLLEAQLLIEEWRKHYNTKRPHSALGYRPPASETIVQMDQRPIMH